MNPNGYWDDDENQHPGPDFDAPVEWDPIDGPEIDDNSGASGPSVRERYDNAKDLVDKTKDLRDRAKANQLKRSGQEAGADAAKGAKTAGTASKGAEEAAAAAKGAKTAGTAAKAAGAAAEATNPVGWALLAADALKNKKVRRALMTAISLPVLIILAIIVFFLFLIMGAGQFQGVDTKERVTEATNRTHFYAIQTRRSLLRNLAYFEDPNNCGEPVDCRLIPGITQKELDKMRNLENRDLVIEDSDVIHSGGKMYLKRFGYRSLDGKITYVDKQTFPEKYREDPVLYGALEQITSNGSIFWRSPRSLDRFALYGASRNNPYDQEATDVEQLVEPFRENVFGQTGTVQQLDFGLNDPIDTRVPEIKSTMYSSGIPSSTISNTTAFDMKNNDRVIQQQIAEDQTKTEVLGVFDGLPNKEKVCSFIRGFDAMNFNIKLTKARALSKYGAHFMTMADANKVGYATDKHVALMNGIQNAPSTATDSWNMRFSTSEGYLLRTQGLIETTGAPDSSKLNEPDLTKPLRVRGTGGSARAALGGNPSLLYINQLVGNLNVATPVDDATGMPFWTTEDLIAAYNFSGDWCETLYNKTGDPSGDQLRLMRMLLGQYMTSQFLLNQAGGINPDPRTDIEHGYGSGNAVTAGVGALAAGVGRGIGMEALRYKDFNPNIKEANNNSNIHGYTGDNDQKIDNYRNNLCNDRTISGYGIATDMFCNIQWGYTKDVMLGGEYEPRKVVNYLRTETDWPINTPCYKDSIINPSIVAVIIRGPDGLNDPGVETSLACIKAQEEGLVKVPHINENGEVETQRYADYMANCIESDKPIIDQWNMGEYQWHSESAAYCATKEDEIFRFFRLFVFDSNIIESDKLSIEDTLGKSSTSMTALSFASQGSGGVAGGSGGAGGGSSGGAVNPGQVSNLLAKVQEFAWGDGRRGSAQKPAYAAAVAQSSYKGGANGNDCGAFVYILMRESGFEPNYPGTNSAGQNAWLAQNWTKIASPGNVDISKLQPGDVAYRPGHVFVWTGPVSGFVGTSVEAALGSNTAPTAITSSNTYSDPNKYTWYRKP